MSLINCTPSRTLSQLKNAHFELCPQEVCLRPYQPNGIASHVYFVQWPREGSSVVLFMRLHRHGQWFFLSHIYIYIYIYVRKCIHGERKLFWFLSSLQDCINVGISHQVHFLFVFFICHKTSPFNLISGTVQLLLTLCKPTCRSILPVRFTVCHISIYKLQQCTFHEISFTISPQSSIKKW
jgi:hypothetical protein